MSTTRDFDAIHLAYAVNRIGSNGECVKALRHYISISIRQEIKLLPFVFSYSGAQKNIIHSPFSSHPHLLPSKKKMWIHQDTCRSMVPPLVPHGPSQGQRCMPPVPHCQKKSQPFFRCPSPSIPPQKKMKKLLGHPVRARPSRRVAHPHHWELLGPQVR